jgi:hypothetical protein
MRYAADRAMLGNYLTHRRTLVRASPTLETTQEVVQSRLPTRLSDGPPGLMIVLARNLVMPTFVAVSMTLLTVSLLSMSVVVPAD